MSVFRDCMKEAKGSRLQRLFVCVPIALDRWWRYRDFHFNRSYGGWTRRLALDGHSPIAFLWPMALLLFLVFGPTLGWRGWPAVILVLSGWGALYAAARWIPARWLFGVELAVLALWGVLVWTIAGRDALEHGATLYRHFLIPLYLGLIAVPLLILWFLARFAIGRVDPEPDFRQFLPHVSLFAKPPEPPRFDFFTVARSFVQVPIQHPLPLLFVPSVVLLFLPYYFSVDWKWGLGLLLGWWLVLSSFADHRIGNTLHLMRRAFFIGGQLVVSLVVIVLAAGRVVGNSYVQTVVESSNVTTMLSYLLSAYVVFWFNEYWLNRLLLERLLKLLGRTDDALGRTEYDLAPGEQADRSAIEPAGRCLQIHGGGRFLSLGRLKGSSQEAFEPFEKGDLFDEIVRKAGWSPAVGHEARSAETLEKLAQLRRATRFYFGFANLLLILLAVGAGIALAGGTQLAALQVPLPKPPPPTEKPAPGSDAESGKLLDLADLIWPEPSEKPGESKEPKDKVILIAASGGGTRAALYTHSLLHGLARLGVLDDVVLGSGVSGGGAALAYFAAHRQELLDAGPDHAIWTDFGCTVGSPFIWDVLRGVSEWRIVTGTRAGKLLQESFERGFANPREPEVKTIGKAKLGLIFNTGLAGRLKVCQSDPRTDFAKAASSQRKNTDGSIGGGRLILTNLKVGEAFGKDHPGLNLPYEVIDDPEVPLTTAAALHANFPPIFSNAPIDSVDAGFRYWVTDGGAVENRGLISLLLLLRGELKRLEEQGSLPTHLPEIHIVMAEASAGSLRYSQDRGVGTAFGATGKVASQLLRELLEEVEQRYRRMCLDSGDPAEPAQHCGKVVYHDLPMPAFLRIDSGLGTHWMMPRTVEMHQGSETVVLDGPAVRWLIDALHQPERGQEPPRCGWEGAGWTPFDDLRVALNLAQPRELQLEKADGWAREAKNPSAARLEETYMAESHREGWDRFRCLYAGEGCPPRTEP